MDELNETQLPGDEQANAPTEQPAIDYYGEGAKLLVERCLRDAANDNSRQNRDRQDLKALYFDRGGEDGQWIVYDESSNSYVPRPRGKGPGALPDWCPRPVTNFFKDKIDGVAALLDQSQPAQDFKARTDDDGDAAAADVAKDALPVIREEINHAMLRQRLNRGITLMNRMAVVYSFDNDPKHGMEPIQAVECLTPECPDPLHFPMEIDENEGKCPGCGGEAFQAATYPQGHPQAGQAVGEEFPKGRLQAQDLAPFEFSSPSTARTPDAREWPWFLAHNRIPLQDVHRLWPKSRGRVENDGGAGKSSIQVQFADTMARLSSPINDPRFSQGTGGRSTSNAAPVVYRLWHDPIEDKDGNTVIHFPEGFYGVYINQQLVDAGPLPFKDREGRPFKNVLTRVFRQQTGTQYGAPVADDLIPLQVSFNRTDMLLQIDLMTTAMPTTFVPTTVTFEDEPEGVPGEWLRYRSHDGQKPFQERGSSPPEGLYAYLDQIESRFDKMSKLNAVLQGQRPEGGQPTLGEVLTLQERGMMAFHAPVTSLVEFEKAESRMLLEIARQTWWSPRFRLIEGDNGQSKLRHFWGADLDGAIDLVCEPSSAWPRSIIGEQLKIEALVGMGVLVPNADPELALKLLTRLGLSELKPSIDVYQQSVLRDLDRWRAGQVQPPQPYWGPALPIHLTLKQLFLATEEAEELQQANPGLFAQMVQHVQMLQLMLAPPAPAAAGDNAGGGKSPDGRAVDEAVASGALLPAGGQGGSVEDLVAQGALVPAGVGDAEAGAAAVTIDDLVAARALTPSPQISGDVPR